ncbi:MAG: hypothetical protein MK135_04165 [Polyangiaceae bacterium]|nr:hypothetical protein [Polyangiaceae bacterium]
MSSSPNSSEWPQASFKSHTMILALSRLAETVLIAAHQDRDFLDQLANWESAPREPQANHTMLSTGWDQGRLLVLARDRKAEFCIVLEHPQFKCLAPVAFRREGRLLTAIWLAQFEGDLLAGIDFCQGLKEQVEQRRLGDSLTESTQIQFPSHRNHQYTNN